MRGAPFAGLAAVLLARALALGGRRPDRGTEERVLGLLGPLQRTRKPLGPKGTRVWRDRAHHTEVRAAERRAAKRAGR